MSEQPARPHGPQTPERHRPGARSRLAALSIGHLLADFYGIFPAPLLRSFGSHLAVSYASVGLLLGITGMANGLAGVVVGLVADRWRHRYRTLILLGAAVTVLAMSAIGITGTYWSLMAVTTVGAFACGAFHPPGFTAAGDVTHPHRSRGLGIVMAAGIAGGALGPLFVSHVVRVAGGVWATPFCALPGVVLLGVAALLLGPSDAPADPAAPESAELEGGDCASPRAGWWVLLLLVNATARAFAHVSILVLISELMENVWGLSVVASGVGVGALQLGAGLGALVGARLTPYGRERRTILACVPPSMLALLPMALASGRVWWMLLLVYGFCTNAPASVVVSLAQKIAPARKALVSGLMVGVAFGAGGQLAAITSPRILGSLGQSQAVGFLVLPLALSWVTAAVLPRNSDDR